MSRQFLPRSLGCWNIHHHYTYLLKVVYATFNLYAFGIFPRRTHFYIMADASAVVDVEGTAAGLPVDPRGR